MGLELSYKFKKFLFLCEYMLIKSSFLTNKFVERLQKLQEEFGTIHKEDLMTIAFEIF